MINRKIVLGNSLPVPMNILPSPRSIKNCFSKLKTIFSSQKTNETGQLRTERKPERIETIIRLGPIRVGTNNNRKRSIRQRRSTDLKALTYPVVIERIVKRFLLYYQMTHQGLEEIKNGFEFREVKQDISSLRYEISHEIDVIERLYLSNKHSMTVFNANINDIFSTEKLIN